MCVHGAFFIMIRGKEGVSFIAELNKKKIIKYMKDK